MSWENILKWSTVIVAILTVGLFVKWVTITATVTYLYTKADTGSTNTLCLWGYRPWHEDIRYFCSDDVNKVMDAMAKLNAVRK